MDQPATKAQFALPVDSENKATELRILSFARPHMSSFHVNWMAFFCTFVSTFAPAALIPAVRDALDLTKEDIGNAGIAAVTGTIVTRVVMGSLCDMLGPRICMVAMLLISAAPTFGMALATSPLDFIMCRFGIGFGLGSFVACQYWTSSMFNVKIVGMANATAAGWGNLGGGVTQLLLPLVYAAICTSVAPYTAWRWAFYVPAGMHVVTGIMCLFIGQDSPDGNFKTLKDSGAMKQDSSLTCFLTAVTNYRMFILMILYGTCFGIELTMNNIITSYLYDQFELNLTVAGVVGSCFGLMNLFARSFGGYLSDKLSVKMGMRGRIWALFITILFEGVFCIAMGFSSGSLAATVVFMITFSTFVQAAEGATFAVVPFVSKRALGVVSGFCGAGGNLGAVMAQYLFFTKDSMSTDDGIKYTGYLVTASAFLAMFIYFPMWGSMFTGPKEGFTEEHYYLSEYTEEERAAGMADAALRFANESKSQRGIKADLEKLGDQEKNSDTA